MGVGFDWGGGGGRGLIQQVLANQISEVKYKEFQKPVCMCFVRGVGRRRCVHAEEVVDSTK